MDLDMMKNIARIKQQGMPESMIVENTKSCCCTLKFAWRRIFLIVIGLCFCVLLINYLVGNGIWLFNSSNNNIDVNNYDSSTIRHLFQSSRIKRLPSCIIIGVKKGGTQALISFLDLHPDIVVANNEIHFFDRAENYSKGYDWYREQMPHSYPHQITMEKSPAYFVTEGVPELIHKMNSSIKLLIIVRNPVIRTISDYAQIHAKKLARNKSHEDLPDVILDKTSGKVDVTSPFIYRSIYYTHMEKWLQTFRAHQIHVVNGDVLIREPWKELHDVETFLGISHHISKNVFEFNETKGFMCYEKSDQTVCLDNSKGRDHPEIDSHLRDKLHQFYRMHNEKFYKQIDRDFGWEKQSA